MPSVKFRLYLTIFLLPLLIIPGLYGTESYPDKRNNYFTLQKMYGNWDAGLFGSRKLYRNRLHRLLTDMIGKEVQTGGDYKISIPDVFEKRYYSSDLYNYNWLQIHGPAGDASIKWFAEKGGDYIKEVERNKLLFFLSGRIKKFRITESDYERTVHLYLESVRITDSAD
ncbi:MAG: hypothetical protein CVV49_03385 [Spirochaetae bacterium HGW-Spirochaetae-5]|nr:MAG: hypothetical protein CVV49_03385 [Spirochaetae bacterium HGW-Spirochaetae-5]